MAPYGWYWPTSKTTTTTTVKSTTTSTTTEKNHKFDKNYRFFNRYPTRTTSTLPPFPFRPTQSLNTNKADPQSASLGLGSTAIIFISVSGLLLLLVLLISLYVAFCRKKQKNFSDDDYPIRRKVGRAIERISFMTMSFRHKNKPEPIVLNYPDPDSHLPNYKIKTPYSFLSTSTIAQSQNELQKLSKTENSSSYLSLHRNTIQ